MAAIRELSPKPKLDEGVCMPEMPESFANTDMLVPPILPSASIKGPVLLRCECIIVTCCRVKLLSITDGGLLVSEGVLKLSTGDGGGIVELGHL